MEDDVPEPVKRERLERLTELQRSITAEKYESRIGTRTQLIVDRIPDGVAVGRLPWQADDIDGITYLDEMHAPGTLLEVAVEDVVDDYDFKASVVRVISSEANAPVAAPRKSLPMAGITIGSYGK
jgi:ribosomal protein S12 methylthiotransferase